jgi:hypothetical protein
MMARIMCTRVHTTKNAWLMLVLDGVGDVGVLGWHELHKLYVCSCACLQAALV